MPGEFDCLVDFRQHLGFHRVNLGLGGDVLGEQPFLVDADGVPLLPLLHFLVLAVGVADNAAETQRMIVVPVGAALDEGRALPGPRPGDRRRHRLVHGDGILSVHQHSRNVVGCRTVGDVFHSDHLFETAGYGVLVVLTEKHHRQLPNGRQVDGLVERAFVAGPVAEEGHRHPVVALQPAAQGSAHRRGDGGTKDTRLAQNSHTEVGQVHGTALALTEAGALAQQLGHRLFDVAALGDRVPVGPVIAGHPVVVTQGQTSAHGHGFLPDVGVGRPYDFTTFNHLDDSFFEVPDAQHSPEHLHQ